MDLDWPLSKLCRFTNIRKDPIVGVEAIEWSIRFEEFLALGKSSLINGKIFLNILVFL